MRARVSQHPLAPHGTHEPVPRQRRRPLARLHDPQLALVPLALRVRAAPQEEVNQSVRGLPLPFQRLLHPPEARSSVPGVVAVVLAHQHAQPLRQIAVLPHVAAGVKARYRGEVEGHDLVPLGRAVGSDVAQAAQKKRAHGVHPMD